MFSGFIISKLTQADYLSVLLFIFHQVIPSFQKYRM